MKENQLSNVKTSPGDKKNAGGLTKGGPASRGGKVIEQLQQFPPQLRKKIKVFLDKIPVNTKKYQKEEMLFEKEVYEKIPWILLKEKSDEFSSLKNKPIFLFIPNYKGIMTPFAQEEKDKVEIHLLSRDFDGKCAFLDDTYGSEVVFRAGNLLMKCYKYFAMVDGETSIVYTMTRVPFINSTYFFNALKLPIYTKAKTIKGKVNVVENVYICTEFSQLKEDFSVIWPCLKNIKNIHDLSLVWDFDNNRNIYSDIETYIILSNLLYVEEGNCALDLILCGKPSAKKTSWLDMLSEIFGDKVVMSVNATEKSLGVSFFSDTPKQGVLCESKYVTPLDDFFRMFSQRSEKVGYYSAIKLGLERIMNILDRKVMVVPSGKMNTEIKYMASFFATDNFGYNEVISDIYSNDPAIFKRFTFLLMDRESEEKGSSVYERDINDVISLLKRRLKNVFGEGCFNKYRLLFTYLRNVASNVTFDEAKFREVISKYRKYDIHAYGKAKALIKSIVVLNTIIRYDGSRALRVSDFKAKDEDYVLFEKLMDRVVKDFIKATKRVVLIDEEFKKLKEENVNES